MERQCPVCGEVVTDDALEYCPICGTALPEADVGTEDEEEVFIASIDENSDDDIFSGNEDDELELGKIEEELEDLESDENKPGEVREENIEGIENTEALVEEAPNEEYPVQEQRTKDTEKEPEKSKMSAEKELKSPEDSQGAKTSAVKREKRKKNKKKRSRKRKKSALDGKLEERKKIREKIEEETTKKKEENVRKIFDYYTLNTATTTFFVILAVFTLVDFMLIIFNITDWVPKSMLSIAPMLGTILGPENDAALFIAVLLLSLDAALHHWDRKNNLKASIVVTLIMIFGLILSVITYEDTFDVISALMILLVFGLIVAIDWISILRYPSILEDPGREKLEEFLLREAEIEAIIEEEEEKLALKEQQIEELQQNIELMGQELAEEEEKLRMKDEEIARIQSQIEMKEQELLAEEEQIQMKEQELQTVIESELKQRMQEQMMEEEERLRMKEEELIRAKNELEIQRKLHEESREKLRMKEQELNTLRSELEKQIRERLEEEEKLKMKEAATRMKEQEKQKRVLFPFTAMVGQEDMKKALVLNAIYPEIGGVLIKGNKGTGKSVSVRGLSEVLPDIEVTGCRFNCDPNDVENLCPECKAKYEKGELESFKRPVKVVDLPLNITEDRLLGSIDIEKILKEGTRSFEPGLLAEAHRGILYVDEINLLDDYIVDLLLDAASSGRVVIEREGISFTHPARFIIVGSMNPEEGELRPQLLDRLALQVDVVGIKDVEERMEIVRRRKEFTENPELFREKWSPQQEELKRRITDAKERIASISTPPHILDIIGKLCVEFDVDGHRADIIVERAARANAAYEGRNEVSIEDVIVAATYTLPHRARKIEGEFSREFVEKAVRRLEKGGS